MHKLKFLIPPVFAWLLLSIPTYAQSKGGGACKDPNGRTQERTNPSQTQRNQEGCVTPPYMQECATQNCYNCEDFQYQEDAQAFFDSFSNDPSGLDGRPGPATAGVPNKACEALPSRGS